MIAKLASLREDWFFMAKRKTRKRTRVNKELMTKVDNKYPSALNPSWAEYRDLISMAVNIKPFPKLIIAANTKNQLGKRTSGSSFICELGVASESYFEGLLMLGMLVNRNRGSNQVYPEYRNRFSLTSGIMILLNLDRL